MEVAGQTFLMEVAGTKPSFNGSRWCKPIFNGSRWYKPIFNGSRWCKTFI